MMCAGVGAMEMSLPKGFLTMMAQALLSAVTMYFLH